MRFPFWSLALWIINGGLEVAILRTAIRRRSLPGLGTFQLLIGVTVLSDVVAAALLLAVPAGRIYGWCYWTAQAMEILLRSMLALQILAHVLQPHLRKIVTVAAYFLLWFGVALYQHFRPDTFAMLKVSSAGNFIALALITAAIVIPSGDWPRGWSAVSFGLFTAAMLDLSLALFARNTGFSHFFAFQVAYQFAPIPGLLLFYFAARDGDSRRQTHLKSRARAVAA